MKTLQHTTLALALLLAAGTAQAGWIGSTNGTAYADVRNYTNTANWAGGVIDDDFSGVTLTGNTTLHFTGDHATGSGGINASHAGSSTFALQGNGGDRTLKLNGPFTYQPVSDKTLTVGAAGNGLVLDLGGANRAFQVGIDTGTGRGHVTMTRGLISNGGIVKTGRGTLNLNVEQPYTGPTLVNMGSVTIIGSGSIRNSSVVHVRPTSSTAGADVNSHELVAGLNDRLGDSAPIVLSSEVGGSTRALFAEGIWMASGSIDASEDIGPLILRSGMVAVNHGYKYLNVKKFFSGYLRTDSEALIRSNRTVAVFVTAHPDYEISTFNNPAIGEWRTTHGTTNCGNRFVFATPPPTIGGTNSRGTDSPVVPFLVGKDTSVVFSSNHADTLLTYDANGLRALRTVTNIVGQLPEYVTSVAAANADGNDNVYLRALETVASDKTINALVSNNGSLRINAGAKVTVRSGLLNLKGVTFGVDGANGALDVGSSEGVIVRTATGGSDGVTFYLPLAGSNGYTFAAYNGWIPFWGTNSYSGPTTIACGTIEFKAKAAYAKSNVYFPDDGQVLVHPGAILIVGNKDYWANEIIGSLAGGGTVRLGSISHATDATRRHSMVIGEGGTGAPGTITLDGGVVAPGLENETGTLFVTTESNTPNNAIPVTLANGTFQVDIAGAGVCDVLSTMGAVNINAGGNLAIEVDVNGYKPGIGQQWTILTSANGPVADGNGGKLVNAITDNSDRVNFAASIALDGKSLVLTALDATPGTVLMVR